MFVFLDFMMAMYSEEMQALQMTWSLWHQGNVWSNFTLAQKFTLIIFRWY